MESQYNYEQEIDLKDLMFAVLRKWRPIILIAIVFAVLLGGMKGAGALKQMKDSEYLAAKQQEYDNSMDQYAISKASLEKEVENIKASLESQNEYMEKSVLMNINPYDEYVTAADFYVGTDYQIMPVWLSESQYSFQHYAGIYVHDSERRYVQLCLKRHERSPGSQISSGTGDSYA